MLAWFFTLAAFFQSAPENLNCHNFRAPSVTEISSLFTQLVSQRITSYRGKNQNKCNTKTRLSSRQWNTNEPGKTNVAPTSLVAMRRGPGIAAINRKKLAKERYATKGTELSEAEVVHMTKQLDSFKSYLEKFATQHQNDIKKNQEFRQHFQKMCARIGVDPLASSKGFWAEILGVGDFYYELGVQITEACLATKSTNGGLITLEELHKLVLKGRSKTRQDVSVDDLIRAIKKLHVLGSGFQVIPLQGRQLVQSVPGELNSDHTTLLQSAQKSGYTSLSMLADELNWDKHRSEQVLNYLIQEGMIWVDEQGPKETLYWVPGFFK